MGDSTFGAVLDRMYRRVGVAALPGHVERTYGLKITKAAELDVGVFRLDRADGGPLVARLFSAARPPGDVEADLAVLRYLADLDYPAERPFGDALSRYEGQSVLITEFLEAAPKARQPPNPIVRLGARVAVLNGLDVPPGADRPAGALHHYAVGTVSDELRALTDWLDSVEDEMPNSAAFEALHTAVAEADGGDGLPEALVHPDPVPRNTILTPDGPVLVDWASAGRGPRLAAMTRTLRSSWAGVPFLKGWVKRATLTAEERERLPGLLFSRGLTDLVFRICRDPSAASTAPARIAALRRDSEKKAEKLLAAV